MDVAVLRLIADVLFFNKMLAEVKSNLPCPCLFPNAAACYRNVNVLLGGGFAVESTHALVCSRAMYFALQPVVERLREINLELQCGTWTTAFSLELFLLSEH